MSPRARLDLAEMGFGRGDLVVQRNEEGGVPYSSPTEALSPSSRRSICTFATPPLDDIT